MEETQNNTPEKKETLEIKKDSLYKGVIGILAIVLVISIFTGGFGYGKGEVTGQVIAPTDKAPTTVKPTAAEPTIDMKALMDDDAVKGNPNAPVTIVEFSDYECPFCARFYSAAYQDILKNYVDTGKVKLVFRDFPLSFHENAQKAAEAAECAGDQGKYYEMHDLLFSKGVEGGITTFKNYATTLGLDQEKFDTCLDQGTHEAEIKKDMADGQKAGVRGTPAFLIDGKLISGARPFSVFEEAIEAALN